MMRAIVLTASCLLMLGCGSSTPDVVDDAKLKLWTAYNDNIYTAKCQPKQEQEWFVVCEKDSSNQAIYWIQQIADKDYVIHAMNGKAKTHAQSLSGLPISDFYLDGSYPKAESAWEKLQETL